MKLRFVGVMATAVVALLVTSIPTLAADSGVASGVVGRASIGSAKSGYKWLGLRTPYIEDQPEGSVAYSTDEAIVRLTLQGRRKSTTRKTCAAVAWVNQWDRDNHEWVELLERDLTTSSTTTRKRYATEEGYYFQWDGDVTSLSVATNGYCTGVVATLSVSQPWSVSSD